MANTKNTHKVAALVTYAIALVCLLAGLFVPFVGKSFAVENMLALQLPDAVRQALYLNWSTVPGNPLALSYPIAFFGLGNQVNFAAYLVLAYAVVTLLGIILLIPAIAGKKTKRTAMNVAFFIEALATLILGILILTQLNLYTVLAFAWNWSVTIAFGGALLMMILQRIICNGGSGWIKTILFILSVAAVLFAVYYPEILITALAKPLADLVGNVKSLSLGVYGAAEGGYVSLLPTASLLFEGAKAYFTGPFGALEMTDKIFTIFAMVLAAIVLINLFLDMLGIAKKTNNFMLVCNQVRYIIEILAIIGVVIMTLVLKYNIGIMLILLAVIAIIQYVINLIRLLRYANAVEKEQNARTYDDSYSYFEQPETAPAKDGTVAPVAYAPAQNAQPAQQPTQTVVETRNVVYNVKNIYNGPTDDFINKLNNDEKIEFASVFLERSKGSLSVIPAYNIGGENKKFFSCVIIYYSRVRDLISDGLMNKLYQEGKMM